MSHSQFHSLNQFILRHAWLNLCRLSLAFQQGLDYLLSKSECLDDKRLAHQHLVCELHSQGLTGQSSPLRAWLQIVHCNIFVVFTIPEAINLALHTFRSKVGRQIFRMSPQFDGVAQIARTAKVGQGLSKLICLPPLRKCYRVLRLASLSGYYRVPKIKTSI